MAITATDIHFRRTAASGTVGNAVTNCAAGASLGGYMSNADITDAALNNLFDDITGDQNAANQVDYQALFVLNDHATLPWQLPTFWKTAEVAGGADMTAAWDSTAANPKAQSGTPQSLTIANKTTAPAALSFVMYTDKTTSIAGTGDTTNINATYCKALWVKRAITGGPVAAIDNDGITIRIEGDTSA